VALKLLLRTHMAHRRAATDGVEQTGGIAAGGVVRAAILVWVGYTGFRHLADPEYFSLLSGVTFGAHEFGHLAFAPFGATLGVAGGSLMQLLVPIGAGALLATRRDWAGLAFAACWLAISMVDLARYVADARARERPRVSRSPAGGLLALDLRIAGAIRRSAAILLLVSLAAGAWHCLRTLVPQARRSPSAA
jgi:hypothetical protein